MEHASSWPGSRNGGTARNARSPTRPACPNGSSATPASSCRRWRRRLGHDLAGVQRQGRRPAGPPPHTHQRKDRGSRPSRSARRSINSSRESNRSSATRGAGVARSRAEVLFQTRGAATQMQGFWPTTTRANCTIGRVAAERTVIARRIAPLASDGRDRNRWKTGCRRPTSQGGRPIL